MREKILHQRLKGKAGVSHTWRIAVEKPNVFFTTTDNPRSIEVLRQMEPEVNRLHGEVVVLLPGACSELCKRGVALFDGMPRNRFSPVVPSQCKSAPAWAREARFGVVIGNEAERGGCSKAIIGIFLNPRNTERKGVLPWGDPKTASRKNKGRRRSKRPYDYVPLGWRHGGFA